MNTHATKSIPINANVTFVSFDEIERADAFMQGDETVCQHPIEVGVLGNDDVLILDNNIVLFGDNAQLVETARSTANNGVPVGIFGYNLDKPEILALRANPLIVFAKTQVGVRAKLRRLIAARRFVQVP